MKLMKKLLAITAIGLFSFVLLACSDEYVAPTGENVGSFASYDDLKEYRQGFYEESDGFYYLGGMYRMEESLVGATLNSDYLAEYDSQETPDYSTTNNQVEGVDEADRILTDGYKIYIASGSKFFIVDAVTLDIDYTLELDNGSFQGLYLYQGRVVLL